MRLPRDISGKQLVQKLKKLGYTPTRQTGSHIRLAEKQKKNTTTLRFQTIPR